MLTCVDRLQHGYHLKYKGYTRQVIEHIDMHCSNESKVKFKAEVSMHDPTILDWIGESGCDKLTPRSQRLMVRGNV